MYIYVCMQFLLFKASVINYCLFAPFHFLSHFDSNWTLWNFFWGTMLQRKVLKEYIKAAVGRKAIFFCNRTNILYKRQIKVSIVRFLTSVVHIDRDRIE